MKSHLFICFHIYNIVNIGIYYIPIIYVHVGINDFNEVYQESKHCSADWEDIGSLLGISKYTIAIIKEDNPQRCEHRMNAMLTHWLKKMDNHANPSWKSLCKALYIVDRDTADQIAEKHHITNYIKPEGM